MNKANLQASGSSTVREKANKANRSKQNTHYNSAAARLKLFKGRRIYFIEIDSSALE